MYLMNSPKMSNQNTMIGIAKYHFFGFPSFQRYFASSRNCSNSAEGINRIVNDMSAGNMIRSSRYPKTGIKSGIKSIGESAYTTTNPANTFAMIGVFLLFRLRNNAGISIFSCAAFSFNFIITSDNLFLSICE